MNRSLRIVLFVLMSAVILAAPASIILRYERVLQDGRAFRFRTAPVDPYDAFRGRYVQLRFDSLTGPLSPGMVHDRNKTVYATLAEDTQGFVRVENLSEKPPAGASDYVKMDMGWQSMEDVSNRVVRLNPPFNQYFMNEKLAPAAEKAYGQLNRRGTTNVWAVVRVLNGRGVIENLMFEGVPAVEYLKDQGL